MTKSATVFELFSGTARRYADRPFLHAPPETAKIYGLSKTDYAYGEALGAVEEFASLYASLGAGAGHRIGLALENRPEFFLHFLALNSLGASILPLNCAMQLGELRYQIGHSECALIVAAPQHRALILEAVSGSHFTPLVVDPGRLKNSSPLIPAKAGVQVSGSSAAMREAAILYTSGTTGAPKGCILPNDYFLAIANHYTGLGGHVQFDEGAERIITPLPVTHMNALACSFMAAIRTGGCLIQLDRFHPKSWWATVRESGATIMHYLGVMPAMLLKAPEMAGDDFSGQVKFAFGAGCDPRHHAAFEKRFGVPLIEAWAMTETGAGAWITAAHEPRHVGTRCFGRAPEGLEYRLVDEEGHDVEAGAAGELLVRRAGDDSRRYFFSGYLKDEAATEDAWRGGWFHTGDAVRVDDDRCFHFVDRLKNVIRRSGENIAAIDVESVLMRHEGVAACVIVPVPDEIRGDEVMALVVPASGRKDEGLASEIFSFAMENLAYFKAPGYIAFVDTIPMTASEKVKRGEAKALARSLVERGACYDFKALKTRVSVPQQSGAIAYGPLPSPACGRGQGEGASTRAGLSVYGPSPPTPLPQAGEGGRTHGAICGGPELAEEKRLPRARNRHCYDGVVAVAPVTVPYERYSAKSAHGLIGRALKALAEKTGLAPADFDGFCASSFTLGADTAVGLTQHFGLSPRWLDHIPMGGASGVVALRRAARAVQSGDAEIVACVAGDANDRGSFGGLVSAFSRFSEDAAYPYGSGGPNMSFALITRAYMKKYGATREDFGKLCVAQRDNALKFPYALMKKPLTMEDYLSARPIADPLHLYDCVMPCAGAEAFAVMREEAARAMSLPFVRILSTVERCNAFREDDIQLRGGWAMDKDELWAMAGVSPGEADFLETYDDYPVVSMMQIEDLGFCKKGEAKDFVRAHTLTTDGTFPHNTSGGQLSVGQAGAAGGYLGLVEAIRQLTGEALGATVKDAKVGVVSGFGMINFDRGLCSAAAVLAAGGANG